MGGAITPVGGLTAEQVRTALVAATAAPSLHNSQPWRLHTGPDTIDLFADRSRAVRVADPDHRELTLACGAALLNLRIAVKSMGVFPDVRVLPDYGCPDLFATVRPAGRRVTTTVDTALANAIPKRRTNRRPFAGASVPAPVRHELRRAAEIERTWLAVVQPTELPLLWNLACKAHEVQLADPEFRAEWAHWTGGAGPCPDGGGLEPDPLIAVIGSFQDAPTAWLQAGQAMQRVLLTATAAGLSASFVPQVVEVPEIRRELRELIGGAVWPQVVLRIGKGDPASAA